MTAPQFHLHWELGLPAAGPLRAFAASAGGRILLGSFEGVKRNRLIVLDQAKSQLVRADIDTGDHVITCVAWAPNCHFFLGNNHGDVYSGSLQDDDILRLNEILVGLGDGAPIIAVSFSLRQNVLAVAIGSRVHMYRFSGGSLHDGHNWTYLKSLEPFGDATVITTMKFIGHGLSQLIVGSSEGMSVWLTENFTVRPLTADYAFAVVHCATNSGGDYVAVTTQAQTLVVWPLFDSGPATYERRVISIPERQSSLEEVSPLALTDSGLAVMRSLTGYIVFKNLAKPTQGDRQEYGTHCKINSLEAQGDYLFTGGSSPTGLLTLASWSSRPADFDQDPQRPVPITPLGEVLCALERPAAKKIDAPNACTTDAGHTVYNAIRRLSVSVVGLILVACIISIARHAAVLFDRPPNDSLRSDDAQPPSGNMPIVRKDTYGFIQPLTMMLPFVESAFERLVIFLGYTHTKLSFLVTEYPDAVSGGAIVVLTFYAAFINP